jgi:chromosome partitioning protein
MRRAAALVQIREQRSISRANCRPVSQNAALGLRHGACVRRLWKRHNIRAPQDIMQRIVVLNPKGGSGKTTIAINLASHFALHGQRPVLMDYDPQGSSAHFAAKRDRTRARIHLIKAFERDPRVTRTFQLRIPEGTGRVIVDTPAAIDAEEMPELTRTADKILVPVLPAEIDIHACSRCVQNLLVIAKVQRNDNRLGIIANRVRRNTVAYQSLSRFLLALGIPIVATLRDSQNYVRAVELGIGLEEMKPYDVAEDLASWQSLLEWLELPSHRSSAPVGMPAVRLA